MENASLYIVGVILIAFVFDFINGFHDAANSIATIVTTGVLSPRQAVVWAAFFNFIAFLFFNLSVAKTIGNGLIAPQALNASLILVALLSAISWNLLTWYYGLPSSSSHALIGGLIGAAIVKAGLGALVTSGILKIYIGILFAPFIGLLASYFLGTFLSRYFPKKTQNNTTLKILQLFSSALLSITHGGNDAQKTMGIIAVLLFSASWLGDTFYIPFWVVVSCHAVISLGTLAGGWRIVRVMGTEITKLNSLKGCAAEAGAAAVIFAATELGTPISTTHTVTGAIVGVGLLNGINAVNLTKILQIYGGWFLTLPVVGFISATLMKIVL